MANYDALTDLPNRVQLMYWLGRQIDNSVESRPMSILICDLDRFKVINDSLGHQYGDELLKVMKQRLLRVVREGDYVSRLGGDEFAIVLNHADDQATTESVARRIIELVNEPVNLHDNLAYISVSIGISRYPQDGDSPESLLKNADIAMFHVKESGKNGFEFYHSEMHGLASKRFTLETELRGAVQREELELYYQPQVALESGKIIGAEALIRWNHPVRGLLSPVEFIPVAEETDLILAVGQWVIHTACMDAAKWSREYGEDIRVGINVAARQFFSGALKTSVEKSINESGVKPKYIELELTENIVMNNAAEALDIMYEIKDLGVRLSIDDFGTGYSSLAHLKQFPIDVLKIDRSFVKDILKDQDDEAIVRAIIAMAKQLQVNVIAEGAEESGQVQFLSALGCDEVQGFYFSKPVPEREFYRILRDGVKPYK